jgi:predicted ATPase/DNA-binding SARP family transcriptional activator
VSEADRSTAPLVIRLFGAMEVQRQGRPLPPLRARAGRWLLALLALYHDRDVERDALAALLWPDSSEEQAAYNLRRNLTDLRRALGPDAARLRSPTLRTLRLDLTGADVDLIAFDGAITRGGVSDLEQAIALYRGPLLEDCLEDWAVAERATREQGYLSALETLADRAITDGDPTRAERYLRRAIACDLFRESAQRALMRCLAEQGQHAAVSLVYRDLSGLLQRELNTEPDPETTRLLQELRRQSPATPRSVLRAPCSALRVRNCSNGERGARSTERVPIPISSFVGREHELLAVKTSLATARLLTLSGTAGIGKTRLAIQVAHDAADHYPDGAWFVDLAPLSDPDLVPQAVAQTLGVREASDAPMTATLRQFLESRLLLLVLDNCEHLTAACARLAELLLSACAGLKILGTSRQVLGITGEVVWRVPSLSLPEGSGQWPLTTLLHSEAVRLFVDRATAVAPGFRLSEQNAAPVASVCRRLDGIPLAIELAAARMRSMSVEQLLVRLHDLFDLLSSGSRTALPRQQTLRAAIDWSYDLLSGPERALLRRLSIFPGGFTLDTLEAVCGGDVLDRLGLLIDKSLVLVDTATGRYRLLETIRQYALERLTASAECEATRARHRAWCLALAEEGEAELHGPDQALWLERLDGEMANFRAALEEAPGRRDGYSLQLAAALWPFWYRRGHVKEGLMWLQRALAVDVSTGSASPARARALHGAAILCHERCEYETARRYEEASMVIWRHLGDPKALASSLDQLGHIVNAQNDYARAAALFEERLALRREISDTAGMGASLNALGYMALFFRDFDRAAELCGESLRLRREIGDRWGMAYSLEFLAQAAIEQGKNDEAASLLDECLTVRRQLGDERGIAATLLNLARVARERRDWDRATAACEESRSIWERIGSAHGVAASTEALGAVNGARGDLPRATELYLESLASWRKVGVAHRIVECLDRLAGLACDLGQLERGIRLLGAAESAWNTLGAHRSTAARARVEERLAAARAALGDAAVTAAGEAGRGLSMDDAMAEALGG